ncbi:hypothetical protein H3966_11295 [Staphylococcus epidermidis]|uniref:hypothetical protein n=1 Tax=Staphylococcus epidermidis TaxID=1282 RepID=UPI0018896D00|nr:hypothetical protein [Staphylococcus epidermidis]MBF2224214.1 hypothetical protein [Staphylococcus epidermidis]MBF2226373.1 hypothetical protein [Staphylococcus epidermidis]
MRRSSQIVLLLLIGVLLINIVNSIYIANSSNEYSKESKHTDLFGIITHNNQKATHDGIINTPVGLDKYYRNKFYDAERKIKDGKNIDKDIKELKDNVASDSSEKRKYDNKTNIMSGYKSALVTLNELNENNKKGNKKNNELLIDNINEQLSYSQREAIKVSRKDE